MLKKTSALSSADVQSRRDAFYQDLHRDLAQRCEHFDALSAQVCFNIAQTFSRAEALLTDQALDTGVTLAGLNVLIILSQHGEKGCALNILSHLLVVSRANITGIVDSLVRKGLMTRTAHTEDRRVLIARITKKGRSLLSSYMPKHYGLMREMSSVLTKDEKESLIRILTKVRGSLINRSKS